MKIQVIQTQFLDDVIDSIYDVFYRLGINGIRPNAEWVFNHIDLLYDLVKKCIDKDKEEIMLGAEDDDYPTDQLQSIESWGRMMVDLSIIQDLEVPHYANPKYIGNAVLILSEKFSEQLQAKANEEAYYNEYYCKQLAEVLAELCEIIKEA